MENSENKNPQKEPWTLTRIINTIKKIILTILVIAVGGFILYLIVWYIRDRDGFVRAENKLFQDVWGIFKQLLFLGFWAFIGWNGLLKMFNRGIFASKGKSH